MAAIIFTLCSNNYLAHAKTLGDSIKKYDPDVHFVIGLVDEFHPDVDYNQYKNFEIIKYDTIGFPFFKEMIAAYNIIEFNTSVKPYYFEYLFKRSGADSKVLYIDPDIAAYASLQPLFDLLEQHSIIVTPNLTREPDDVAPGELASLRHGVFNLGFIGVRNSEEGMRFTKWWEKRLRTHCVIDKPRGIFVDQKWVDLAPIYFKDLHVIYHPGYNMAWWNLDERKLNTDQDKYFVNDRQHELMFFHFSGYQPGSVNYTGRNINSTEYSFEKRPELTGIFQQYNAALQTNGFATLSKLKPLLPFGTAKKKAPKTFKGTLKSGVKSFLKKF